MRHLLTVIRRTIRAAVTAGQALITAARGYRFGLLVALFRAVDTRTAVRIAYRKPDGTESSRVIEPVELRATEAGDITVRAADHQSGEDRTFRVDRITDYEPAKEASMSTTAIAVAPRYRAVNDVEWVFTGRYELDGSPLYLEAHLNPSTAPRDWFVTPDHLEWAVGPLTRIA